MEALTHLVSESLARYGFDRPLDYRRLHWSRWFRCESPHSLLLVPSKPGVFALAEEIANFDPEKNRGESAPLSYSSEPESGSKNGDARSRNPQNGRRMLAVTQFVEAEDMAFVLDRMLARQNPMRALLNSGRYFVRFVVIEEAFQRRSICNALNQWIANSAEKVSGIGAHFATSLELSEDNVKPADAEAKVPANSTVGVEPMDASQAKVPDRRSTSAPFSLAPLPSGF